MRDAPLTRRDFQLLADLRAREAGSLLRSRNPNGSYYLGGYAVEFALKDWIEVRGQIQSALLMESADTIRMIEILD